MNLFFLKMRFFLFFGFFVISVVQYGLDRPQVCQSSVTTQTSPTAGHHLALLYHSSHHHHHHHSVHPQLPASVRRPSSRLPPAIYTRPPEIKALVYSIHVYRFFIAFKLCAHFIQLPIIMFYCFFFALSYANSDIKCLQRHCQLYTGS